MSRKQRRNWKCGLEQCDGEVLKNSVSIRWKDVEFERSWQSYFQRQDFVLVVLTFRVLLSHCQLDFM